MFLKSYRASYPDVSSMILTAALFSSIGLFILPEGVFLTYEMLGCFWNGTWVVPAAVLCKVIRFQWLKLEGFELKLV